MASEERLISIVTRELALKDMAVSGLDKRSQQTYLAKANMGIKEGLYTSPVQTRNLTVSEGAWSGRDSFDPTTHSHSGRIAL